MSPVEAFRRAMEEAGLTPPDHLEADGVLRRFRPSDAKPGDKPGWYVLYNDPPAGAFGEWRKGISETWKGNGSSLSTEDREQIDSQIEEARAKGEEEQRTKHEDAARRAGGIWEGAEPAPADHPYLEAKRIKAHGIRQHKDLLVVPVRDVVGELQTLQFVTGSGNKRFLKGGKTRGGLHLIGEPGDGRLVVCEGYATAATIHETTDLPVAVAFNAGNLEPVAESLRGAYPDAELIVAADNDRRTDGNPGVTQAEQAANAVGGRVVVPEFPEGSTGTDFNDLAAELGVGAVRARFDEEAAGSEPEAVASTWGPPLPLDHWGRLPAFPVNELPPVIVNFVKEVAESRQVPVDMPAVSALAVLAAAAAGHYRVELPSHSEPLNIFVACALPPGLRKTQTLSDVTGPVHEAEARLVDSLQHRVDEDRASREVADARAKKLQNQAAKSDEPGQRAELQKELAQLHADTAEPVTLPRLIFDDATPERVAQLLAENNGRLAMFSAEGGIVGMMAGRYNERGGPNLDVYLKAHAGDPLRVDRASGRAVNLRQGPALTLCLLIQPEVLRELAGVKGGRGRGLLGRFLYSLPGSNIGRRFYNEKRIEPAAESRYEDLILRLFGVQPEGEPRGLKLEGDALRVWVSFHDRIECRLSEDGDLHHLADWGAKAAGAAARIAGSIHVAKHPQPDQVPIEPDTVAAAVAIADYFVSHAGAAFSRMKDSPTRELAQRAYNWLDRHDWPEEFSRRDLHQHVRTDPPNDLVPALKLLEERAIIRQVETPKIQGPGRPPSPQYVTNPNLRNPSQNSQKGGETPEEGVFVNFVKGSRGSETESDRDTPHELNELNEENSPPPGINSFSSFNSQGVSPGNGRSGTEGELPP